LSSARIANRIEPFNGRTAATLAIARARDYLSRGDVDSAYRAMLPLSTEVRGDALFRETYQRVLALKTPTDARKAHQQHAREKPDGGLDPEDVER
jgi:hypothetical protein